jgi:hypothetical protein
MKNTQNELTVVDALEIQRNQRDAWEKKLSWACWTAMDQWLTEENQRLRSDSLGRDVLRGDDLLRFIQNWPQGTYAKTMKAQESVEVANKVAKTQTELENRMGGSFLVSLAERDL